MPHGPKVAMQTMHQGVWNRWQMDSRAILFDKQLAVVAASILTVPKLVTLTLFFIGIFLLASLLPPVMLMDFNSEPNGTCRVYCPNKMALV